MIQLSLRFDSKDGNKLVKAKVKSGLTWENFILELLKGGLDNGNK